MFCYPALTCGYAAGMTDQEQAEQYERLRIARARRRHTREIRERAAYSLALAELYEEPGDA